MRSSLLTLLGKSGWKVTRISNAMPTTANLDLALHTMLADKATLKIVQVGANDGRINDPIHQFASGHPDRTSLLLIEPQESLHPYLSASYSEHPSIKIAPHLVGRRSDLKLFAVRSDCWADCAVPYAVGWPPYRAPTGISSSSYQRVLIWVEKYYKGDLNPADVIAEIPVESLPLRPILEKYDFGTQIDLLQIDAEGFDDEVIYSSEIEAIRPSLINFESSLLEDARASALMSFLAANSYSCFHSGRDTLAILGSREG